MGLEEKDQTDLILLDFSKAFDKVPHKRLLLKSEYLGIRGSTLLWIQDFLSNRSQQVMVDGSVSSEAQITLGVPQGSVLGPLLFLIYISDLPSCARSSETRLFADDYVLYRCITSSHEHDLLQEDLDSLQRWEEKWLMEFNPTKYQVVKITNKRNPLPTSYNILGHTLEVVNSAKCLGVEIDSKLSFNSHVDSICKKANSTRAFLSRNFSKCSRNIKEACYTSYVRPIAEYAASSWDPHTQRDIKKVEQVQRSSARFVMYNYVITLSSTVISCQFNFAKFVFFELLSVQ